MGELECVFVFSYKDVTFWNTVPMIYSYIAQEFHLIDTMNRLNSDKVNIE